MGPISFVLDYVAEVFRNKNRSFGNTQYKLAVLRALVRRVQTFALVYVRNIAQARSGLMKLTFRT